MDPFELTRALEKKEGDDETFASGRDHLWIAAPRRDDADGHKGSDAVKIGLAALESPHAAWDAVHASPPDAMGVLPDSLALVLGAEFVRAGSPGLGRRLLAAVERIGISPRAVEGYVQDGAVDPHLWRLDPEERAALDFVRARQEDSLGEPSAALYKSARERDILKGWISRLADAWPRPSVAKPGDFVVLRPK